MTVFRILFAWLLAATLALAAPLAVAAHGSAADSGAHHHAGHSHADLNYDDGHGEDSDTGRPAQPYHDQTAADHSHQTPGLVRAQTIERPALQRQWRLAADSEIRFAATFRLERPPRS